MLVYAFSYDLTYSMFHSFNHVRGNIAVIMAQVHGHVGGAPMFCCKCVSQCAKLACNFQKKKNLFALNACFGVFV